MEAQSWPIGSPNGYRHDTSRGGTGIEANQAAVLKAGDLLIVYQGAVWQVAPDSGAVTRLFVIRRPHDFTLWRAIPNADGFIYCTASGYVPPPDFDNPVQNIHFGTWGEVFRVTTRGRTIETITELVDPIEIEFRENSQLLVCDFNNWGGVGQIYLVHKDIGTRATLVDGGLVTEPYSAHMDEDGVIWVANAHGLEYDAEIVKVEPDGGQAIVRRKQGLYSGVISSVFPGPKSDRILGVIVDWPFMTKSAIFEFDKRTYEMRTVLGASEDHPAVFSPGCAIDGKTLWTAEAYHNELIQLDLKSKDVIRRIDISAIKGGDRGIMHAWDFFESVSIVPDDWPA